mgnify:CR=1 FL=1
MDGSVWDVQRALIVGRQAATRLSIARSRDRDLAWCERELGDVPARVGADWRNLTWSGTTRLTFADGSHVETVQRVRPEFAPVESLGRDQ